MGAGKLSLIALSVPAFFFLIGVELLVSRALGRPVYRFEDTITDLSCGMLQQLLGLLLRGALAFGYLGVYEHARVFTLPGDTWWAWAIAFVGVDFCYYWFHRMSHERPLLWAAHVVHHQSEEYNLAVALRQDSKQQLFSWIYYLPLAVLGVPPALFFTMAAINTLYQFWIHTRLIGRLGPLEWILNTPSHHRVHHGRDPQYLDRNHGGTLIVWDRWFGTFEPEGAPPTYGVTKALASWDPVKANLRPYVELWQRSRGTGLSGWWRTWWHKTPRAELEAGARAAVYPPFAVRASAAARVWASFQFLLALAGVLALMGGLPLETFTKAYLGLAVAVTLWGVGLVLEGHRMARNFELARCVAVAAGGVWVLLA